MSSFVFSIPQMPIGGSEQRRNHQVRGISLCLSAFCCLLLIEFSVAVSIDQVYELVPDAPIEVPLGELSYIESLTPSDGGTGGAFVFIRKTQSTNKAMIRIFDVVAKSTFAQKAEITFDLPVTDAQMLSVRAGPFSDGELCSHYSTGTAGGLWRLYVGTDTKPFYLKNLANPATEAITTSNKTRQVLRVTGIPRILWLQQESSTEFHIFQKIQGFDSKMGTIVVAAGFVPAIIDRVNYQSSLLILIDRAGIVYFTDAMVATTPAVAVTVPDFRPRSATPIGTTTVEMLVPEYRDASNQHLLSSLQLDSKATTDATRVLFTRPSLVVNALGPLSPILRLSSSLKFTVFDGTKFYMFNLLSATIEADTEFVSQQFSGYVPDSLVVGNFGTVRNTYFQRTPAMGIFLTGTGYTVKMLIFDETGCSVRGDDQVCSKCKVGFKLTSTNSCTVCGPEECLTPPPPTPKPSDPSPPAGGSADQNCAEGSSFFGGQCVKCAKAAPSALYLDKDQPRCVNTEEFPYTEGFREVQTTPFRVIEECSVGNCKKCPVQTDICTECKTTHRLAFNYVTKKAVCLQPQPDARFRREMLRNTVDLLFDEVPTQRPQFEVKVVDLNQEKVYSCEELGCSQQWSHNILKTTFKTDVQVTRGVLMFFKTKSARVLQVDQPRRLLQTESQDFISITDFQLVKEGWFFSWTVVAQLIIFFYRSIVSLAVFGSHPTAGMAMDWLITQCLLLGLYLGPFLATSELVLQIIGQVKLIWYWFPNPFLEWDPTTLTCWTRPNHGIHGLRCALFDNYGQNIIGFAAFAMLLTLLHHIARWISRNSTRFPKLQIICHNVETLYGIRYWVEKLNSNQLEVMIFVMISYSYNDGSSNSVIGLTLGTLLLIFFSLVTIAKSAMLYQRLQIGAKTSQTSQSTGEHVLPNSIPPQSENDFASTHREQPKSCPLRVRVLSWAQQCLVTGARPITHKLQLFAPIFIWLRTIAICVLLLNHSKSATLQLVLAIIIKAAYLCSMFLTRCEEHWYNFYGSVGVQTLLVAFLIIKAVSTNSGIPILQNQGLVATILSIVVCLMFLTTFASVNFAFINTVKTALKIRKSDERTDLKMPAESSRPLQLMTVNEEQSPQLPISLHRENSRNHQRDIEEVSIEVPAENFALSTQRGVLSSNQKPRLLAIGKPDSIKE